MRKVWMVLSLFVVGLFVGVGFWWFGKGGRSSSSVVSFGDKVEVRSLEDERVKMKW